MCLQIVDKETKQYTEGYRVFRKRKGILYNSCFDMHKKQYRRRWLKDTSDKEIIYARTDNNNYLFYNGGYHFFKNKEDAINWCVYSNEAVYKIKVKNVVASGQLYFSMRYFDCGVAKEIFIEECVHSGGPIKAIKNENGTNFIGGTK